MMHALRSLGKPVTVIIGDSEPPTTLSHLPGFDQIKLNNFFEINIPDYDLFIIQDSGSPDQISKLRPIKFPDSLETVVIDHHSTNTQFAQINLIDTAYPAVCQILYDLFKIWGVNISEAIAACLYIGIYTDTGGFKYPPTTSDTLLIGADLAKINPNFPADIFLLENSFAPQHISYLGLALTSIEHYFSGHVAISAVPFSELKRLGIKKTHTEKTDISNILKSVVGWDIGIGFTETEPGVVNLSLRTRDEKKYNVAKIAFATGYGGGHPAAAGGTLNLPYDQAKKFLLDTIARVYPELGPP